MARINIEDDIYKDIRFITLIAKTGDVNTALGALVRAWSLAQKYYLDSETDRLIPKVEWKKQGMLDTILEVGLAEELENGIKVSGSEKQFAWLLQKSKAGKKSVELRRNNKENKKRTPVNVRSTELNGSERLGTSSSISFSTSNSSSNSFKNLVSKETKSQNKNFAPKTSEFIKKYCELWKTKHGSNPPITGKDTGIAKRICKTLSDVKITQYLEAYFQMPDAWYIKKRHPIEIFESQLKEIAAFSETGEFITKKQMYDADKTVGIRAQLARIEKTGGK